jgi:hypothetical protein
MIRNGREKNSMRETEYADMEVERSKASVFQFVCRVENTFGIRGQ